MAQPPFVVLIPARLASSRLPNKPLADLAGLPMVVRVAQRALQSQASLVVVAADDPSIVQACQTHGVQALLTRSDHVSGSDRLAEAASLLGLADETLVVNVQGDEPLIEPGLIDAVAWALANAPDCSMSTLAHAIDNVADWCSPHVVKVVLNAAQRASYFSRASIPVWRDGPADQLPPHPVLRHVGLYAYRVGFLKTFPLMSPAPTELAESLEQLRALWHGHHIVVHVSDQVSAAGVDTPEDLARVRGILTDVSRK
jgi:3-deoxy-manno-octulosonate cytidylyltransferase (CMP-KDO synthetase)